MNSVDVCASLRQQRVYLLL